MSDSQLSVFLGRIHSLALRLRTEMVEGGCVQAFVAPFGFSEASAVRFPNTQHLLRRLRKCGDVDLGYDNLGRGVGAGCCVGHVGASYISSSTPLIQLCLCGFRVRARWLLRNSLDTTIHD